LTARPVAIDTSVAVPLLVGSHQHHDSVAKWADGRQSIALCGHALVETFAVLTRLPGDARVAPADAASLIDENFAEPLVLPPEAAHDAHHRLAAAEISGGATYDGLVALAAREHGVILATRDARACSTYEALGVTVELV